ncbi:RNA polymerase sigma factor [Planctomycetes bacterium TBK1r]|uniref:RNA polymerase sigma factor SigX n=1 Tax=Stieleria magnilauensis TaxID=2527963 RepID=A0ABX5XYE0_9BACT|nr:RNA polymerase sigma factor SigX [Planctomycetes bacterium TBK1r]
MSMSPTKTSDSPADDDDAVLDDDTLMMELLGRLNGGDAIATEEVFVRFEPYLRMIVRRQISGRLNAKFDSSDIVQSIWADLLIGFRNGRWRFDDGKHLRAFLAKATQNRFLDRVRRQQGALHHERTLTRVDEEQLTPADPSRPSTQAHLNELWSNLLHACSPQHRQILEMKRHGKSLAEIAAATGFHESSVRRILYDLARDYASSRESQQ